MNNKIVYLLLLLMPIVNNAQKILVKGTVYDSQDVALPGAKIEIKQTDESTLTDFDGNFE